MKDQMQELALRDQNKTAENIPKDKIKNNILDNSTNSKAISEIMAIVEEKDIREVFERLKDK